MNLKSMIVFDAVLLAITVILGIVLASSGKPYSVAIFTVHKLTALGSVVLTSILFYNLFKNTSSSGLCIFIIAITGVSVIALFISGAFMSAGKAAYHSLRIYHIISSTLLTACEIGIIIHLIGKLR